MQGAGHPTRACGMCCGRAILSGYSESCTELIEDIINEKGVATGRGVGTK